MVMANVLGMYSYKTYGMSHSQEQDWPTFMGTSMRAKTNKKQKKLRLVRILEHFHFSPFSSSPSFLHLRQA